MSEEKKRAVILQPSRMGLAEHERQDHIVNAEVGTTIDDILQPGYWASVAPNMKMYDHIEVRDEAGEWIATFIALDVGRNYAKVFLTARYDIAGLERVTIPDLHRVDFRGPQHKWCVVRNSDNEVLQSKMPTRDAASVWMQNHEQVIAAK